MTLPGMREMKGLGQMVLLRRSRLSVQPVKPAEWRIIVEAGGLDSRAARG